MFTTIYITVEKVISTKLFKIISCNKKQTARSHLWLCDKEEKILVDQIRLNGLFGKFSTVFCNF